MRILFLLLCLILWALYAYSVFVTPKMMKQAAEMGQELPVPQVILGNISNVCLSWGPFIIIFLLAMTALSAYSLAAGGRDAAER